MGGGANLNSALVLPALAVAGTAVLCYMIAKKLLSNRKPKELVWRKVGTVEDLLLYPLKSGRALRLKKVFCDRLGPRAVDGPFRDRSFVVVYDSAGEERKWVNVRQHPKMVTIGLDYDTSSSRYHLSQSDEGSVDIGAESDWSECGPIVLWDVTVSADALLDCGDEAARLVSSVAFGKPEGARLIYHKDSTKALRPPRGRHVGIWPESFDDQCTPAFGDCSSYLLTTSGSMTELTNRLGESRSDLKEDRFRSNIVVRTDDGAPFEEDNWMNLVRIGGGATLRFARYCNRCPFTLIDPDTGVMDRDGEPLKTLRKFRQIDMISPALAATKKKHILDSPVFGSDYGLEVAGEVAVGDDVFVGEYV